MTKKDKIKEIEKVIKYFIAEGLVKKTEKGYELYSQEELDIQLKVYES